MSAADREEQLDRTVSAVDRQVSHQVRLRRLALGLTQHQLADLVGVTYQQVHKYERGLNRISAGQLQAIALALGTNVASFFEHIEPKPVPTRQLDHQQRLIELMHNVQRIAKPEHRHVVCAVAKALAELSEQRPPEPA